MLVRVLLVSAASAVGLLLLAQAGEGRSTALTTPVPTCSPSPSDCSGWYRTDVSVSWQYDPTGVINTVGCASATISSDTTGTPQSCSVTTGSGTVSVTVTIHRDATPPTVSGGSAARGSDSGGWYNHPVDISFSGSDSVSGIASCTSTTYSGPDSGSASVQGTCTDQAGNTSAPATFNLQYDATPPSVSAVPARPADSGGWYNHPVAVAFNGSDSTSGISSCSSGSYSGPDSGAASVGGSCRDVAGNSASATFSLQYDATPPSATASADRQPDKNGWYNHPLTVSFTGEDATSGVDSCTPPMTYRGPVTTSGKLPGTCTDKAGNRSAPAEVDFKYDSTPPSISHFVVAAADSAATLTWVTSPDTTVVEVERSLGGGGRAEAMVYTGSKKTFVDMRLRNGRRYRYTVTGYDQAGNSATATAFALPTSMLLGPAEDGEVPAAKPVVLAWTRLARADYYNVQLFRNGAKILSAWPTGPQLRLEHEWQYNGHTFTLKPGHYRWLVWPGIGSKAANTYGKRLGLRDFTVTP
jgi:hypothetical protein